MVANNTNHVINKYKIIVLIPVSFGIILVKLSTIGEMIESQVLPDTKKYELGQRQSQTQFSS